MNILVLCTGNSARSILLESLFNHTSDGRVFAFSAGSQPAGRVHPAALALLKREGHETGVFHSKSWDVFGEKGAPKMDVVITVCGSAAGETCPIWPGAPIRAHWGVEDPAAAQGDATAPAFEQAFTILSQRAAKFLSVPIETLDAKDLQAHLVASGSVT